MSDSLSLILPPISNAVTVLAGLVCENEHPVSNRQRLPALNFEEVKELAACRFIDNKLDVVAIGPPGHGKTHLALAIGYEAAKQG